MKTQTVERNVMSHGFQESRKATIKANAHAFNILSSGLYTDKVRAVLRELSTNAYDAHVEAGKSNVPFYVKMPTSLDPTFKIRDYGVGLSHEDAMELYNTYFHSTKNDTNDAIGALGLGSKSPYSYTTAFSVVSYYNGMKRVYNSGLDEEGCPVCNFVYEEPTDEVNGLEVSFAVNKNDFHEFNEKASLVFRRFNPLPNVVGYQEEVYEPTLPEVILEGNGWRLTKNNSHRYNKKQIAIMGNIEYPIDCNALTVKALINTLTGNNENNEAYLDWDTANIFERLNIELDFNIGDLEIAASREGLGYTSQTNQILADRINQVIQEIYKKFESKILQAKNYREACRMYNEFDSDIRAILNRTGDLVYDGKIVGSRIFLSFNNLINDAAKDEEEFKEIRTARPQIKNYFFKNIMSRSYGSVYSQKERLRCETHDMSYDRSLAIDPEENTMIIVDDVQKKTTKRIVRWNLQQSDKHTKAYVINIPQEYPANKLLKAILDYLDCEDEIYYISQMEDEPKEERAKQTTRAKFTLYRYAHNRSFRNRYTMEPKVSYQWEKITNFNDFDPNEVYYYIPVTRYLAVHPRNENETYDPVDLKNLLSHANDTFGFNLERIYGVSKSNVKNLDQLSGTWVNLYEAIKTHLKPYTTDKNFIGRISNAKAIQGIVYGSMAPSRTQENINNIIQKLGQQSGKEIKKYSKKVNKVFTHGEKTQDDKNIESLLQRFDMMPKLRDEEIAQELKEIENNIEEKYELFWYLLNECSRYISEEREEYTDKIARYIKQMDELEACKGSEIA